MSKRLAMLEKMTAGGATDPFAWYALALEYAGASRLDDALATYRALRALKEDYVPMYLMCGTMLAKAGRAEEAREWLTEGRRVARVAGDMHADGELAEALASLEAKD
jgi:predicted Zn-dependent protease